MYLLFAGLFLLDRPNTLINPTDEYYALVIHDTSLQYLQPSSTFPIAFLITVPALHTIFQPFCHSLLFRGLKLYFSILRILRTLSRLL